ncbi:hypothetical protein HPB49_020729 [Dermacentor silvarum]|uniref:Uncharacterized protein n=1 Tax=Dermacentor silvarum TaxID=543639 RepID=A0ACB8CB48_DERSI|nr:hypothetical protein HPB49_020729 [Dermacentor silvarum]
MLESLARSFTSPDEEEEVHPTVGGLTLPTLEPPPPRSSSPSPTAELMRGAGTTPILAHMPEPGFGDLDTSEEPWPSEPFEPATTAATAATTSSAASSGWLGFDQGRPHETTSTAVCCDCLELYWLACNGQSSDARFSSLDSFGDVLQPRPLMSGLASPATSAPTACEAPLAASKAPASTGGGLLKGDLDATLASLAQNLDINGPKQAAARKTSGGGHQWGSPKPAGKTGGTNWTPVGGAWAGSGSPQHLFQPQPQPTLPAAPVAGAQWGPMGGTLDPRLWCHSDLKWEHSPL